MKIVEEIRIIIEESRANAVRSVDFCRVQMYWRIGQRIVEEEQGGKARAEYGQYIIRNLSKELIPDYGSGFTTRQLERARQFYLAYPIASAVRTQFNWTQYKLLIAISDKDKREYYELEAAKNNWTARELERQIQSGLMRCFAVVELKLGKANHTDLGQLQMYVNYYDRYVKLPDENPTIGILLCAEKNDTLVRLSLPEGNKTIMAAKYQMYLPTEEQLISEIEKVKSLIKQDSKNRTSFP